MQKDRVLQDEKIIRGRLIFQRGSGRQNGEKGQTGRRPLRREIAKPLERRTLRVLVLCDREIVKNERAKRGDGKGDAFHLVQVEEEPERSEKLKGAEGPDLT